MNTQTEAQPGFLTRLLDRARGVKHQIQRLFAERRKRAAALMAEAANQGLIETYLRTHEVRRLHLGCGRHVLPEWLNTDIYPQTPQVVRFNAIEPFALKDNTFESIYSEHVIEHVTLSEGSQMLSECYRILKPKGRIRISTPDLAFLVRLYTEPNSDLHQRYVEWSMREYLPGVAAKCEAYVLNNFVRAWGHQFIYDESTLRLAFESAGFRNVVRCEFMESPDDALRNLENESRLPPGFVRLESMILEAEK